MTDHPRHTEAEELVALYTLGALGDVETSQFERSLETASPAIQGLVEAFQDVTAELAFAGAAIVPPAFPQGTTHDANCGRTARTAGRGTASAPVNSFMPVTTTGQNQPRSILSHRVSRAAWPW